MEHEDVFSKDPKIREILDLCIQPKSENVMEDILLKFVDKCKELDFIAESNHSWEFDVVCLCVLDYIYENDTASLSAVLRSLYLYVKQTQLPWSDDNRISYIKSDPDSVLKELHEITNLQIHSKCEAILLNIGLACILDGNLGLASFLVKFGFVDFPTELDEKGKKMAEILVKKFNDSFNHPLKDIQAEEMRPSLEFNELLILIRQSKINFRRILLTFCTLVLLSEYRLYEKEEIDSELEVHSELQLFNETMKKSCHKKFMCLNLFIDSTTEIKVTLKDIETFIALFINPLLSANVGKSLIEFSKDIFLKSYEYYNPRSLKDLARCKIRNNLQNSMTFTEQINQFDIPVALKEFLLFQTEVIWDLLTLNFASNELLTQLKLHILLTRLLHIFRNYM